MGGDRLGPNPHNDLSYEYSAINSQRIPYREQFTGFAVGACPAFRSLGVVRAGCLLRFALAARGIDQLGLEAMLSAAPDARLYLSMAQASLSGSEAYEHGFFTFGPGHAWYLASIL